MYKIKEGDIYMEFVSKEAVIEALTGWETDPTDEEIERAVNNLRGINLTCCEIECPNYGLCSFICDVTCVG